MRVFTRRRDADRSTQLIIERRPPSYPNVVADVKPIGHGGKEGRINTYCIDIRSGWGHSGRSIDHPG